MTNPQDAHAGDIIGTVADDETFWIRLCGNMPALEGFFPVDRAGHILDNGAPAWTTHEYIRDQWGRVIDAATRNVPRRLARPIPRMDDRRE